MTPATSMGSTQPTNFMGWRTPESLMALWWAVYMLMVTPLSWRVFPNEFLSARQGWLWVLCLFLAGWVWRQRGPWTFTALQATVLAYGLLHSASTLFHSNFKEASGNPLYLDGPAFQLGWSALVVLLLQLRPRLDLQDLWLKISQVTVLIQVPVLLAQKLGWDVLGAVTGNGHYQTVMGTTGNESIVGHLLLLSGVFLLIRGHFPYWAFAALGVGLCGNLAATVAFLLVATWWVLSQHPTPWWKLWVLIGVLCTGHLGVQSVFGETKTRLDRERSSTFHTRLLFWSVATQQITQHPQKLYLGHGSAGFAESTLLNTTPEQLYRLFYRPFYRVKDHALAAHYLNATSPLNYQLQVQYRGDGGEVQTKTIHDRLYRAHNLLLDSLFSGGWLCFLLVGFWLFQGVKSRTLQELHWANLLFFAVWFAFPINWVLYGFLLATTEPNKKAWLNATPGKTPNLRTETP